VSQNRKLLSITEPELEISYAYEKKHVFRSSERFHLRYDFTKKFILTFQLFAATVRTIASASIAKESA